MEILEKETEKLYDKDSHMKEFEALVTACEEDEKSGGYKVILDRTAFFPEGGGQFGDVGRLDETEVTDTKERGGVIYHKTKEALEPGRRVKGKIDFAVRFDRMQQHSGEHILSGLVHNLYGYDNVGFHLGAEVTTLDFNGEMTEELTGLLPRDMTDSTGKEWAGYITGEVDRDRLLGVCEEYWKTYAERTKETNK